VLADFSSGYDDFVDRNLYGNGPTANEQTDEYAPPAVLLQGLSPWEPFSSANPYSYDSWSIGVLALGKTPTPYCSFQLKSLSNPFNALTIIFLDVADLCRLICVFRIIARHTECLFSRSEDNRTTNKQTPK